ncbi:hypothetical protein ACN2XU_06395 [Primorskyibacter sp. 2E107]
MLFGQSFTPGEVTIVYLAGSRDPSLVPLAPAAVHQAYGGEGQMTRLSFLPGEAIRDDAVMVFAPGDEGRSGSLIFFPKQAMAGTYRATAFGGSRRAIRRSPNALRKWKPCCAAPAWIDAQSETHHIDWGRRFDSAVLDFMNGEVQQVTWRRVGPNACKGALFEVASGPGKVGAGVGTEITSPTQIGSHVDLLIGALMGMDSLSALGLSDCTVYMTFDIDHVPD